MAESLFVMIGLVLADLWPQYGLTISTPRLELRLPHEEELAALAHLAGKGVHRPDERPFLTPWTDGRPEDRAQFVLREHWSQLGQWNVAAWRLGLGVFRQGEPLGMVTVRARDFLVVREVTTSSWPGKQFAMIQPSTTSRIDIGLILPAATPATGRLEPAAKFNPLFTHRVSITAATDLDHELHGWLAAAYALAG